MEIKAISTKDGTEIPLSKLYGNGIKYGAEVIFHENGEIGDHIGISSGEYTESKIVYEISQIDDDSSYYLYFVKKEKVEEDITAKYFRF